MVISSWQSKQTVASWHNTTQPIVFLFAALAAAVIALIVTIPVNATVANEPGNDYSTGFGWALMMPVPCLALVWTIVDILICRFWNLHPIYSLIGAILLLCGYLIVGIFTAIFWEWNDEGAWVPAIFFFINAILHATFMGYAARAINVSKKNAKSNVRMSKCSNVDA